MLLILGFEKKYTHPNIKQPMWLAIIGVTEKRSRLGMMGMMLSMSKQVSLPKISSIPQKMKIGPESDLPPFCTKAFNYNIFFPGRESPVFSHFYEMTWKDFNWLHVPFCSRLPRVWKWNMPLEFMVCLVIRYDFHLKISLQYVQSCGEGVGVCELQPLICHCLSLNKCCVFREIFDVVTVITLSPSTCSLGRYSR